MRVPCQTGAGEGNMSMAHYVAKAVQCDAHSRLRRHCILEELGLRERQPPDHPLLEAAGKLAIGMAAALQAILCR